MKHATDKLAQASDRAKEALARYLRAAAPNMSWQQAVTDLLTDVHHLCARWGLSFDEANTAAQARFRAEKDEYVAGLKDKCQDAAMRPSLASVARPDYAPMMDLPVERSSIDSRWKVRARVRNYFLAVGRHLKKRMTDPVEAVGTVVSLSLFTLLLTWTGHALLRETLGRPSVPKLSPEWEACFKEQYGTRLSGSNARALQYSLAAADALGKGYPSTQGMELSDKYSDAAKAEDRYREKYASLETAEACDQKIGHR